MNKTYFVMLFLIASLLGTILTHAYAESETESLVRLAMQARDHIKSELSNTESVPDEIKKLYEQGSAEIDALNNATKEENTEEARAHFLAAMRIFKEIGQQISQARPVAELALAQDTNTQYGIKPVIDRMEKYVDRLKGIAEKNGVEIDFQALDELITTARNNYNSGDLGSAEKTIGILESLTLDVYNALKDNADQKKAMRAKDFAEKQIQRVDILIVQAKDLGLSENITKNLEQSRLQLIKASNSSQIAKQTKIIITLKNQFDESKANRIDAIIKNLEAKLDKLSTSKRIDTVKLDKAKSMLGELKILISKGNLEDAFKLFNTLNNFINDIENTKIDKNEVNSLRAESLSESKTERIKLKIQQLENELHELAAKADKNAAAKRWIKNSFSLLEQAKSQADDSPKDALNKISEVEKTLKKLYRMLQ
ncbi:MAG: hypothetical protein Q8Q69_03365 [Nitrosopumilaceae archaeon]|nr:hypothetical protein [Nitrosopumilaceae archaeon]